jgi:DNA-binding transcriptional LysR family regulator
MEVRQLQIFRTLAEELNFTRTAERVNTVQSNVTAQIKALEGELGVPLFDRLGRRVVLTDAGQRFRPFADQALEAMERGQRAIRNGSEPSGPLHISAPESQLAYRLPPVLRAFRARFPHVEFRFRPESDQNPVADLESGKVDIVIYMREDPKSEAHRSIRLHTEKISLYGEPSHPLVNRRAVKPADLSGQRLLLTEAGCGYRAKLERILAMQNIRPGNVTEFSSVEAMKQCVYAGMGIALLPDIVVARDVREKLCQALDWAGPSLDVGTFLLWHKDKWVSPAMAAFLELVKSHCEVHAIALNE